MKKNIKDALSDRVMTTEKIEKVLHKIDYAEKLANHERIWFKNIPGVRKNGIKWGWTEEEIQEYTRCKLDVHYFAEKYCKIKREDGSVGQIELRPYQKDILDLFFNNRYSILCASRQSGKTISASIFILHYITFNQDKGVMIAANKAKTTQEILDKIKNIYQLLPFFLKVGLVNWGAKSLSFENGCRIQTEARSKEPSIGFTIDLLYLDEFAHIPANIIEPYYKSVVPTVSSISNSKIIITSTPNGFNLFHRLWEGANLPKGHPNKNPFRALKVLWHEVTDRQGRRYREDAWLQFNPEYLTKNRMSEDFVKKLLKDTGCEIYTHKQADEETGDTVVFLGVRKAEGFAVEDIRGMSLGEHKLLDIFNITTWYEREIKLIGGKENFDQEYNLHFLAGSKRVLEPETLELIAREKVEFVWKYNDALHKRFGEDGYSFVRWHPDLYDTINFKNDYIFAAVDLSEGLGQDYTVFNIFRLQTKSVEDMEIRGVKKIQDAFQLVQIGILHSNKLSVELEVPEYFYTIFFELFNPTRVKIALEYNTFGSTLLAALPKVYDNKNKFGKYVFIKYKHRSADLLKKVGIKLNSDNKKLLVKNYVIKLANKTVVVSDMNTANEINNFVRHETSAGNYVYRAEIGHDDIVMSLIHECTIPDEGCFSEACKSLYASLGQDIRSRITTLMGIKKNTDGISYSVLSGAKAVTHGKYNDAFENRNNGRMSKYLTGNG